MTNGSRLTTPVRPPVEPMLAQLVRELPTGGGWLYEPKWDGFRALVYWDGTDLLIHSRDQRPLGRYFPEVAAGVQQHLPPGTVLDGEIVIAGPHGLDFDALLLRIHPADSRVQLLARDTPASFVAFDLLALNGDDLREAPQIERRRRLEHLLKDAPPPLYLTPATTDRRLAEQWFERFEGAGLDGVVAKQLDQTYQPGARVMLKVKHQRTADCVVAGFRWHKNGPGTAVGSLLLALYDDKGRLHHVGFTATFKTAERKALVAKLEPYRGAADGPWIWPDEAREHFHGPGPGSRWAPGRELETVPLRPELVCEVAFDHWQGDGDRPRAGGRFRHGTTFLRWRPDKPPRECTFDQLTYAVPAELSEIFGQ